MSENKNSGCSSSIGSIAALLTAVAGLLTILFQMGVIGNKAPENSEIVRSGQTESKDSDLESYKAKADELEKKIASIDEQKRQDQEAELKAKLERLEQQLKEKEQSSYGQTNQEETLDLNGQWYAAATPGVVYKIGQYGNSVTFEEISNVYGVQTVTAAGQGTITGNTISLDYNTIFYTQGKGNLKIKNNGSMLSGTLKDLNSGMTMPLSLER